MRNYIVRGITFLFIILVVVFLYCSTSDWKTEECIVCKLKKQANSGSIYMVCVNDGELIELNLKKDFFYKGYPDDDKTLTQINKHICDKQSFIVMKNTDERSIMVSCNGSCKFVKGKCLCQKCSLLINQKDGFEYMYLPELETLVSLLSEEHFYYKGYSILIN